MPLLRFQPLGIRMLVIPTIHHQHVTIGGVEIFYRETRPLGADDPVLLLLHGFPSASHQYRRLMEVLGGRCRIIALDYPGFGHSDVPKPASVGGTFTYSFDNLADVVSRFIERLELNRFFLYVFDFGAPVGLRVAQRMPQRIAGLIIQNGNLYHQGLSEAARAFIALTPHDDGAVEQVDNLLTLDGTKMQYLSGAGDPAAIAPDGWTLDQHFLDLPGRKQPQRDLAFDYKTNLARYEEWQAWLRQHKPPTLVVWGRNDPFFVEAGARAILRDVPDAQLHFFDTGHFALEECLPEIAPLIADFLGLSA